MLAKRLIMVCPTHFYANPETASTNAFQVLGGDEFASDQALSEFETMVETLKSHGIEVFVFESGVTNAPDAIFPNNWFATFPNQTMITFPMLTANRRIEREPKLIAAIQAIGDYKRKAMEELEKETPPQILEGTGSLMLDHERKIGFVGLSSRADLKAIKAFEDISGYKIHRFRTQDESGNPIYHTNVVMTLGEGFAVVGLDLVYEADRAALEEALKNTDRTVVKLSKNQVMRQFAGNMLQVESVDQKRSLILSKTAFDGLSGFQLEELNRWNDQLIVCDIPTIERLGGGSVRCMLAELF
jgi:hypothetical protein